MRVYRASSLGYSLEALVAPHLGYEPVSAPDFLQAAFDEGHRIEPLTIEKLRDLGWEIDSEQLEVEFEVGTEAKVVGHIDGIVHNLGSPMLVEIKMMADKSWQAFKKHGWDTPGLVQKYKYQASAYMIATGLPHVMVAWNKTTEELAFAWAPEPFYSLEDITVKITAAEECISDGVLPEGCDDFPCFFYYLHANKESVQAVTPDDALESALSEWLDLDKRIKQLEKARAILRESILKEHTEEGISAGKIKGACGVTVSTTWVEAKHVEYDVKAHWETRIQGPRNGN